MTLAPPTLGPPVSYIHVIWLAAGPGDVHEYYDELDAERWSIRCVRVYGDRSSVSFSYHSPNWRDVMPEAAIDDPKVINRDSQFRARTILGARLKSLGRQPPHTTIETAALPSKVEDRLNDDTRRPPSLRKPPSIQCAVNGRCVVVPLLRLPAGLPRADVL
jgi:hypothetical protein